MNAFDTVHLLVPFEGLIGYETGSFKTTAELDEDETPEVTELYKRERDASKPERA